MGGNSTWTLPERPLNVADEGQRSTGTIRSARCPNCGATVSVKVPNVPIHQLNHERERAEKAEARLRELE